MLKKILIGFVAVVVIVLAVASTRPDSFHYERSADIGAPAAKIFPFIADLKEWPAWSPYEKLDPGMKRTLSTPSSGVGARFEWDGNAKAGAGEMQITETRPDSSVTMRLHMIKPFDALNEVKFTLIQRENATTVTWAMSGPANLFGKVFGLFVDCEKMVTADFVEGLANLKALAEKPAP